MKKGPVKVPIDGEIHIEEQPYLLFQGCIDLIDSRNGIFSMLDEECRIPNGNDATLIKKYIQVHLTQTKCPFFGFSPKTPDTFAVNHYAGTVQYNIRGFMDKNRNTLNLGIFLFSIPIFYEISLLL